MVEAIGSEYGLWIGIGTFVVETIIVILLYRTVRDYAEVAKLSRVEVKHRFRPWIGPTGNIEFMREIDGRNQYVITIRNYGQLPATSVIGMSAASREMPKRDMVKSNSIEKFDLGPLLPNMEKRYWIFVDTNLVEKTKGEDSSLFTIVYFSYEYGGGVKSGYGMISQLDVGSNTFVHKDMWVDEAL